MHGGRKFYRGSAAAARTYVEADRSHVDDFYLAERTGVTTRYIAEAPTTAAVEGGTHQEHGQQRVREHGPVTVEKAGTLDGDAYERWVGGHDADTGQPRGRLRTDDHALRFVEVVVNGPKIWSLAAALHPAVRCSSSGPR